MSKITDAAGTYVHGGTPGLDRPDYYVLANFGGFSIIHRDPIDDDEARFYQDDLEKINSGRNPLDPEVKAEVEAESFEYVVIYPQATNKDSNEKV